MTEPELAAPDSVFRRSSFCAKDACVEVASIDAGILVRDGKDRSVPVLRFSGPAWTAFLGGLVAGDFRPERD